MVSGAVGALARRGLIAGAGSLILLAAVGCSTGGHGASSSQHKPASPSPSASPINGAMLNLLLLPAGSMPAGYRLDPSGTLNSGPNLPQDMPQPVPASQVCAKLTGTAWILAGGVEAADFAENDYANASRTAEIAQEIDLFRPGDAAKVMSRLWLAFGQCHSFTQQAAGSSAQVTLVRSQLPGVGDEAIKAVTTASLFLGGTTLVAIRVGDAIVTCLDSSPGNDEGAGAVALAERIAQAIRTGQ